ncbi:malto-oligosyltrehalose synthase [Thermoproteota archaeon]
MPKPRSTYRIQLNSKFTFNDLKSILPYLSDLGISHIYASPIFQARRGSQHGYDSVDYNTINPDLEKELSFKGLKKHLDTYSLGWIQDIVPNHMAVDTDNTLLKDIFEFGPFSDYYYYFDINWDHPDPRLKGRLLLPVLNHTFEAACKSHNLKLTLTKQGFLFDSESIQVPLSISSYPFILKTILCLDENLNLCKLISSLNSSVKQDFLNDPLYLNKIKDILNALNRFSANTPDKKNLLRLKDSVLKLIFNDMYLNSLFQDFLMDINKFNKKYHSIFINELHSLQYFNMQHWKTTSDIINYRRFFTINDLIGLNIENNDVFTHANKLIYDLFKSNLIQGIRIDHIDGLYNPSDYLMKIHSKFKDNLLIVEKILEPGETLPSSWPTHGTTGYDFIDNVNGLFLNKAQITKMKTIYQAVTKHKPDYKRIKYQSKKALIKSEMSATFKNLASRLCVLTAADNTVMPAGVCFKVLVELAVCLTVYRTYLDPNFSESKTYGVYINEAFHSAKLFQPKLISELEKLQPFFQINFLKKLPAEKQNAWLDFISCFQQYTGHVMAKGMEDTALYRYCCLLSLNEVGGDPEATHIIDSEFSNESEFSVFCQNRLAHYPFSLNAGTTHDTKRAEDIRMRITALAEYSDEWQAFCLKWMTVNKGRKQLINNKPAPDLNEEYFLYQTLIGAYPLNYEKKFTTRIKNYFIKALREAKIHTNWHEPDTNYERACLDFIDAADLLSDFKTFQAKISYLAHFYSLAQTLLKIACPGIPDFYQGSELWDFRLVDPDNRQPVDFKNRKTVLHEIKKQEGKDLTILLSDLMKNWKDGRLKLYTIYKALHARNTMPDVFEKGSFTPLEIRGENKIHLYGFCRQHQSKKIIVLVPKSLGSLLKCSRAPLGYAFWGDTAVFLEGLGAENWRNCFTGELIGEKTKEKTKEKEKERNFLLAGDILNKFPVGLLCSV